MSPFRSIDQSPLLSRLIQSLAEQVARRRGLPVIIGVFLIIISLIVQSVNVYADSQALELIGVIVHHIGLLMGLIGLLVSEALGR